MLRRPMVLSLVGAFTMLLTSAGPAFAKAVSGAVEVPLISDQQGIKVASDDLDQVIARSNAPQDARYRGLADFVQDELVPIASDVFRQTPGWECVWMDYSGSRDDISEALNTDVVLRPFLNEVPPGTFRPDVGFWVVGAELSLGRKFGKIAGEYPSAGITIDDYFPDRETIADALRTGLRQLVARLSRQGIRPCSPKLKFKSKVIGTAETGRFSVESMAEGELRLDQDGAFQATFSGSSTTVWDQPPCTQVSGTMQGSMAVAGNYEDSDGTLRFSRIDNPSRGGSVVLNCPGVGNIDVPVPASGSAYTESADIRLTLADAAQATTFRTLSPGTTRELSFELSYEGGDMGVADAAQNDPA